MGAVGVEWGCVPKNAEPNEESEIRDDRSVPGRKKDRETEREKQKTDGVRRQRANFLGKVKERERERRLKTKTRKKRKEKKRRKAFFFFFFLFLFSSRQRHPSSGLGKTLPRLFQILVEPFSGSLRAFITDQECNQASLQLLQSLMSITEMRKIMNETECGNKSYKQRLNK